MRIEFIPHFFHFVISFFFVSFNTYYEIRLLYSDALSVEDYKYGSKLEHQTKNNNQNYYTLVITTNKSNNYHRKDNNKNVPILL